MTYNIYYMEFYDGYDGAPFTIDPGCYWRYRRGTREVGPFDGISDAIQDVLDGPQRLVNTTFRILPIGG